MSKDKDSGSSNGTAIVKLDGWAIGKVAPDEFSVMLRENLGELGATPQDFDWIGMPTGGITKWTIPSLDGDKQVDSIEGVVIGFKDGRVYWQEGFDETGGGTPPDCSSDNGHTGIGNPGGDCLLCPLSRFGSKGRGQACSQRRLLFVMRKESRLPLVINLSPTSYVVCRKYFLRLLDEVGLHPSSVVLRIGLNQTKNATGIKYSEVTFERIGTLNEEDNARMKAMSSLIAPRVKRASFDDSSTDQPSPTN